MATTTDPAAGWRCCGFVGWHNSGKTTIVRQVARALMEQGRRVAVLKATDHPVVQLLPHRSGSDTALFQEEGVVRWALAGPDGVVSGHGREDLSGADLAFRLFPEVDWVLVEGFKKDPSIPKVAVAVNPSTRPGDDLQSLLAASPNVAAVVARGDAALPADLPLFGPEQIAELVAFLEQETAPRSPAPVTLWADGRQIPLNRFVRAALHGSLRGFIASLRGTARALEGVVRLRLR